MRRFMTSVALAALTATASAQTIEPTDFVDAFTPVPGSVLTAIGQLLPEWSNAGASFTTKVYDPSIPITEDATVQIVFVSEGAGYDNTLGYFTYTSNPFTIVDRQLIFPKASDSALSTGDTVTLRDADGDVRVFSAGERIGFFLVANGWNDEPAVKSWDADTTEIPTTDAATNSALSKGKGVFTTFDDVNPEQAVGRPDLTRHLACLSMDPVSGFNNDEGFVLVAWEDLDGGSDDDFNDLVVICRASPESAIDTGDMSPGVTGDPDFDGVVGTADHYPNDASRALVTAYPAFGWNAIGLEDLYPAAGDGDYNDTVIAYRFEVVTDAAGDVKDILGTFHVLARGGSLDHRLGLHIPGIPGDATGTVSVERFLSDDEATHVLEDDDLLADIITGGRRFETFLPSTAVALPALPGKVFVNTESTTLERKGASSRLYVTFDTAVDAATLGAPPYDIYCLINDGLGFDVDVHLAGTDAFDVRREGLPPETGAEAFLDDNGFPWMLEVPFNWRYPLETRDVAGAYSKFENWAASHGTQDADWYDTYDSSRVALPANSFVEARTWTVDLPAP
jgi:LruC domain-containing protein